MTTLDRSDAMNLLWKGGTEPDSDPHRCPYRQDGADKKACIELSGRGVEQNKGACCGTVRGSIKFAPCNSSARRCIVCLEIGRRGLKANAVTNPSSGRCLEHLEDAIDAAPRTVRLPAIPVRSLRVTVSAPNRVDDADADSVGTPLPVQRQPPTTVELKTNQENQMPVTTPRDLELFQKLNRDQVWVISRIAYGFDERDSQKALETLPGRTTSDSYASLLASAINGLKIDPNLSGRDKMQKAGKIYLDAKEQGLLEDRVVERQSRAVPPANVAVALEEAQSDGLADSPEEPVQPVETAAPKTDAADSQGRSSTWRDVVERFKAAKSGAGAMPTLLEIRDAVVAMRETEDFANSKVSQLFGFTTSSGPAWTSNAYCLRRLHESVWKLFEEHGDPPMSQAYAISQHEKPEAQIVSVRGWLERTSGTRAQASAPTKPQDPATVEKSVAGAPDAGSGPLTEEHRESDGVQSKHDGRTIGPEDLEVARRMRSRRIMLGISQTEVANAIGVTFQQVQKYETGANRISPARLKTLSSLLKVPVSYFYDGPEGEAISDSNLSDREAMIIRALRQLTEEDGVRILKIVKALIP